MRMEAALSEAWLVLKVITGWLALQQSRADSWGGCDCNLAVHDLCWSLISSHWVGCCWADDESSERALCRMERDFVESRYDPFFPRVPQSDALAHWISGVPASEPTARISKTYQDTEQTQTNSLLSYWSPVSQSDFACNRKPFRPACWL